MPAARRIEAHGKPLHAVALFEFQLACRLQQPLRLKPGCVKTLQIRGGSVQCRQSFLQPGQRFSGRKNAFAGGRLEHHVMIELSQQGIRHVR